MMSETKCHMELNAILHTRGRGHLLNSWEPPLDFMGATSRIPHLLDLVFPVIMFNVINTTHVMLSYYTLLVPLLMCSLNIINII